MTVVRTAADGSPGGHAVPAFLRARAAGIGRRRLVTILAAVALILVAGYLIGQFPGRQAEQIAVAGSFPNTFDAPHPPSVRPLAQDATQILPTIDPERDPEGFARQQEERRIAALLQPVENALAEGRHEQAIGMLNHIRGAVAEVPRAYVLMGRALRARGDAATAADFHLAAIDRDAGYADAYFHFAEAVEDLGDLETALGGMRSFLHLANDGDPFQLKIAQARSAVWEWEAKLGRGEWGSTRGIPPGFTEAELRRDGRGVGIKMPITDGAPAEGPFRYEIKSGEPQEMFKK